MIVICIAVRLFPQCSAMPACSQHELHVSAGVFTNAKGESSGHEALRAPAQMKRKRFGISSQALARQQRFLEQWNAADQRMHASIRVPEAQSKHWVGHAGLMQGRSKMHNPTMLCGYRPNSLKTRPHATSNLGLHASCSYQKPILCMCS